MTTQAPIQPLPVELINPTTDWLQVAIQAAAPITALIVALVALGGVILSNRTTLESAGEERKEGRWRDYLQWRRNELRLLGGDTVKAAVEAVDEYRKLPESQDLITKTSLGPVHGLLRRLFANAENLSFLSAPLTGERCMNVHKAIAGEPLLNAAQAYQRELRQDNAANLGPGVHRPETRQAETDLNAELDKVNALLTQFTQAVKSALKQLDPE